MKITEVLHSGLSTQSHNVNTDVLRLYHGSSRFLKLWTIGAKSGQCGLGLSFLVRACCDEFQSTIFRKFSDNILVLFATLPSDAKMSLLVT